ncbi:MAG: putative metal-binding motif-containing protein [archaeon]|nr:putative metal-binding motif-containing protein [archaeon]
MGLLETHTGSGRNAFISSLISVFVIAVLLAAGPADAVLLEIKDLPDQAYRGSIVNFILEIDIGPHERIPIDVITLEIAGPPGTTTLCSFYPGGNLTPASSAVDKCLALDIKNTRLINMTYGPRAGHDNTTGHDYNYGYGYGFGYGPGDPPYELAYNITWDTLKYGNYNIYGLEGNYTIKMSAKADSTYYHAPQKTIELIKDPDKKDVCNPEGGPYTCSGKFTSTRILSSPCIVGNEMNVTLKVYVNESDKPTLLLLKEHIPEGFTVTCHEGGAFDPVTGILKWYLIESLYLETVVEDVSFTYTLISDGPGTGHIFGTLEDFNTEVYITQGDNVTNCTVNESLLIDNDGDGFPAYIDCDDNNASIYPGAHEVCNGVDDDCDGEIDEGAMNICMDYSTCTPYETCAQCPPEPPELCNGIDDNCNGVIDEDCPSHELYGSLMVTRDMPDSAFAGAQFNVTLDVNVDESNRPPFYFLKEYVPQGVHVTDFGTAAYNPATRTLLWFAAESSHHNTSVEDITYAYKAVSYTVGTYNFTGKIVSWKALIMTGGDKQINII